MLGEQEAYRVDSTVLNEVTTLVEHLPASFDVAIKLLSLTCARSHFQHQNSLVPSWRKQEKVKGLTSNKYYSTHLQELTFKSAHRLHTS
jgi:hypothetical protein